MQKRNFVIRTVIDGEVKIYGKIFVPSKEWLEYDSRLDKLRFAFGLYWKGKTWDDSFVCLWGAEKDFNTTVETGEEYRKWIATAGDGPDVVDNYCPWMWWYRKEVKCSSK